MNHMTGKTVVITGANSGIGKETALALGKMGAKVVLVCRNTDRGTKALAELNKLVPGKFELLIADIGSLKDVEALAQKIKTQYPKLDVLLHNAGVFYQDYTLSPDGIEMTLAVNHVGVFHLTNLLTDHLKKSSPSRIVIVSSALHKKGKGKILSSGKKYNAMKAYNESKLLNLLYMRVLHEKLAGSNVTINCVHPGVVATNIGSANTNLLFKIGSKIISPFLLTPAQGALTSIKVASDPTLEKISDKYFVKEEIADYNRLADDKKLALDMWALTENLIRKL
ncbi:MAG: SDR family oxidoreductase [Bdellovibrionota bacterium]